MSTLEKAQQLFHRGINSTQYTVWKKRAEKARKFYDGDQLSDEEKTALAGRGQPEIPINKIAVNIDNIVGQEIQSRPQIGYRPRSGDEQEKLLAEALSALAMFVQERQDVPFKLSVRNRDRLVYGIGWVEMDYRDDIEIIRKDPFKMLWDIDDMTEKLDDQSYMFSWDWFDIEDAIIMFPEKENELRNLIKKHTDSELQSVLPTSQKDEDFSGVNDEGMFVDAKLNRVKIIEYQYKVPTKAFRVTDETNRVFDTFDEAEAIKRAASLNGEKLIQEIDSTEVWSMFWTDSVELRNEALFVQNNGFTFHPSVFKRDRNGIFMGLVEPAIPAQEELNKRRSKALHLMNTRQIIMDQDAVEDLETLAEEAARPDGIITKRPNRELRFEENIQDANQQLAMMERAERELDLVMGIFPESLGQPTNAVSGIAIQQRQLGSAQNQVRAFDDHRADRKKFGRQLLSVIQSVFTEQQTIEILDDNELVAEIPINNEEEIDGKTVVTLDVRTAVMDIFVEETPIYNAPPEQIAALLQGALQNGQAPFFTSPTMLETLGVPPQQAKKLSAEIAKVLQGQAAASQEGAAQEAAGQPAGPSPTI